MKRVSLQSCAEPHTKKAKTMYVNQSLPMEGTEKEGEKTEKEGEESRKATAAAKMFDRVQIHARRAVDDAVTAVMNEDHSDDAKSELKKKKVLLRS